MSLDAPVWSAITIRKNRERLLDGDIAHAFFAQVKAPRRRGLLSAEHFTVDYTLGEAYASLKSLQRKDQPTPPKDDDPGNPTVGRSRTKGPDARSVKQRGIDVLQVV